MNIDDLKGCFANITDDDLLRDNGNLYAENIELKQEIERLNNLLKETSQTLSKQTTKAITLKSENERLNNIINKAIEEIKKRSTKEVADVYINILKGSDK